MRRTWAYILAAMAFLATGARAQRAGEVEIAVESFGVGRLARVGDWCAVRVALKDSAERARDVLLVVEGFDADGDRPLYQRLIPTDPTSGSGGRWMYFFIPQGSPQALGAVRFSVYEASDDATIQDRPRGRRLGSTTASPTAYLTPREGAIGVVNAGGGAGGTLGLHLYARSLGPQDSTPPTGHERSVIIPGLGPRDIPDHWVGLAFLDVIVWAEGNPADLSEEAARSLREWIERGGHLVVVVPRVAQYWDNAISNPLHAILPRVAMTREEGLSLAGYRPLLTDRAGVALPSNAVRYTFDPRPGEPPDPLDAVIFRAPDARPIVVRRSVGLGHLTLIGLDLAAGTLAANGLPEADVFWHPILGRRGALPTDEELDAMAANFSFREPVFLDKELDRDIAKSGRAAAGIALGFVVFVAYWLLAGPLGYAILKRSGQVRHAWLAFVAAAGLFTAIAWGGAMALRPGAIEGSHVTFLDAVYAQPLVRTRTWASLLIPYYGEATIGVGHPESQRPDVLTAWESAESSISAGGTFPDLRTYAVDGRSPDAMRVPVRSTVKQVRADWAGDPPVGWTFPHPVEETPGGGAIALDAQGRLNGELVHAFPAPLHDAIIIVNRGLPTIGTRPVFPWNARVYAVDTWEPGVPIDLAAMSAQQGLGSLLSNYIDETLSKQVARQAAEGTGVDARTRSRLLVALSLYASLEPPDYVSDQSGSARLQVLRRETHGLDLSVWFGRPCVIVIGHLGIDGDRVECPTPITINGDVRSESVVGRTLVRWVYPLADAPPAYRAGPADGSSPDDPDAPGPG